MSIKEYELKYRCKLKAEIFAAGYRTIKEFALSIGIHPTQLSKIISGIENQQPEIAHKMAAKLGIDFKKLRKLI